MTPRGSISEQTARLIKLTRGEPENATTPGRIIAEPPTFYCIGLEWHIEGDENGNCAAELLYGKKGEREWKPALPMLRVENCIHPAYGVNYGNLLAGSVFNLEPGTEYEVRLRLEDADGGRAERVISARTRAIPAVPEGARVRYVVPGEGGGSGTREDPFRGIRSADASARPGDIILLLPGVYDCETTLKLTSSGEPGRPITWQGQDRDGVILDGGGSRRILSAYRLRHLRFEDIIFRNARCFLAATDAEDIVIRHCKFERPRYIGVIAQGSARNFYIADNEPIGPARWPARKRSSYGISINGTGHIICYNLIRDFWDCISLATDSPQEVVTSSVDIYGNDIRRAVDDAIEADYVRHNLRIYRNRITNCFMALSCQPVFGGPSYLIYNEMYNITKSPYKLNVDPSGMFIAHNTSITVGRGFTSASWHNAIFRNNLIIATDGYSMETSGSPVYTDYNGWNKTPAPPLHQVQ